MVRRVDQEAVPRGHWRFMVFPQLLSWCMCGDCQILGFGFVQPHIDPVRSQADKANTTCTCDYPLPLLDCDQLLSWDNIECSISNIQGVNNVRNKALPPSSGVITSYKIGTRSIRSLVSLSNEQAVMYDGLLGAERMRDFNGSGFLSLRVWMYLFVLFLFFSFFFLLKANI